MVVDGKVMDRDHSREAIANQRKRVRRPMDEIGVVAAHPQRREELWANHRWAALVVDANVHLIG